MWSIIGLGINALGAGLVLLPDVPFFWKRFVHVPPFNWIEKGKEQLYQNGSLHPGQPGFSRISEAVLEGSRPLRSVERMDEVAGNAVSLEIGGDSLEFDEPGFEITRIEKTDDEPLALSTFAVMYTPKAGLAMEKFLADHEMESPDVLGIKAEAPPGRVPEWIDEYEKRTVSRAGMLLLFIGFLVQVIAQLGLLG